MINYVKCIKNNDWSNLTIGKTYEVIHTLSNGDYRIMDNYGINYIYPKGLFKTLAEIRNDKIDKLLGE